MKFFACLSSAAGTLASGVCLSWQSHDPVYRSSVLPSAGYDSDVCECSCTNIPTHVTGLTSYCSAKGYSVPKAFIAAQSPMNNTKGDFWEMVWQFRTPTIVLLTNFKEGKQVRVCLHCATLLSWPSGQIW